MVRYSSVQAYTDNSSNVRAIPYSDAKGGEAKTGGVVKTEKIVNPYGSVAGAGSGDFHVYRHARSREMERLKHLTNADEEQRKDAEFAAKLQAYQEEEVSRTEKKRKKRQRQKEAKMRRKNLEQVGIRTNVTEEKESNVDDEFTYTPIYKDGEDSKPVAQEPSEEAEIHAESASDGEKPEASNEAVPFANDGSFLEMMKRKLEEEQAKKSDTEAGSKEKAAP